MELARRLILLACILAAFKANGQTDFDRPRNFLEIQALFDSATITHESAYQGLAWYHWAMYEEAKYGESDLSFLYLVRSVEKFKKSGKDPLAFHRARVELAKRMARHNLVEEAINMQLDALQYFRETNNLKQEVEVLVSLSKLYQQKKDNAKVLEYRRYFREKNEILRDTMLGISVLNDEIDRLRQEGRQVDAILLAQRTVDLAVQYNNPGVLAQAYYNAGYLNAEKGNFTLALPLLKQALRSAPAADDQLRRNVYHYLSKAYFGLDSTFTAYHYAMEYGKMGDSLLQHDRAAAAQKLAFQFDTKGKRKMIEDLEQEKAEALFQSQQQKLFIAALAVGCGALLLALFFIYRFYRQNIIIARQNQEIKDRQIRQLEDNLKIETMQSMLEGQESERQRVAHDLHDSLGGLLAAARLQVENLPAKFSGGEADREVDKIKSLLDETIAETRQIARNLQPGTLLQFGLIKAVQDLINRVKVKGAPEITFQHFGNFGQLDQQIALNCYRLIQELLQNSLKHAGASEILVQLTRTDLQMDLLVEDDGKGYDPETVNKGMGTGNIVQRVQFMKGDLNIQTAPGQGASTLISIPL